MPITPFGSTKIKVRKTQPPKEINLKDFSGGLDLYENDLNLSLRFSKVLKNFNYEQDGHMALRFGTKFKWNVSPTVTGDIIEVYYFNDKLLCFTANGQIASITDSGTVTAIWNTTIANALPGTPAGWSTGLKSIDFTEFRNELVVCNGVDKPLLITNAHVVKYLQDIPTGSNINTPTGYYCTTVANYCVIAGISSKPNDIYISSTGTSGTWPGDTAPNDAISINVGAYSAVTGGVIRGLSSFRNFLLVHYAETTLIIQLGIFDDAGKHKPVISDTIPQYGVTSHRTIITMQTDVVFSDQKGVHSAKRNIFGGAFETDDYTQRILKGYVADAPYPEADRLKCFAVFNQLEKRIPFHLYKEDDTRKVYALSFSDNLKKRNWSIYEDMPWSAGCVSSKGRIFYSLGSKIFQYGNSAFTDEDYHADKIDEYDSTWAALTAYVTGHRVLQGGVVYIATSNHTSTATFADDLLTSWEEYEGEEISFDWQFPWTDFGQRMKKKKLCYVGNDSLGTATFNIDVFVDGIYKDADDNYNPALSMSFVGGSSGGYGNLDQPYGGGRRSGDERLWQYPVEFKRIKFRIHGSTREELKFSILSLLYILGTYKR